MPRLKCAVWSLHESVAVERVCLKNTFYSVVAKGVCCDSDFPCCVLFVLPLVALPSFALQIYVFILKQLFCVVKTCLFVNGLTACELCVALPFGGKGFASKTPFILLWQKWQMCCNSGFPCCVLLVLPLVALPSFALQVCVFILKQLCCVVKS